MSKILLAVAMGAVAIAVILLSATAVAATFARTFGDGTHRIGKDIPAGTYRAPKVSGGLFGGCYWARLRNFSGGLNAIIANGNESAPALVTIKPSDRGFETARCGRWTSDLRRITKSRTRFGAGTYLVGVDIAPGTYVARAGSRCYWARLRAFTGDFNAIIANANPRGRTIVTISRSDRGFQSNGCGTWTR
jgi:small nuclear ribonucleoprotein (snRNP)-like protein